jgi:hypothetical protein
MFNYPSIPGPAADHFGKPCVAFHKYDGSNLRFFWDRRRGWHLSSSRYSWFTAATPTFGPSIALFQEQFAAGILDVVNRRADYRDITEVVACCEFFGPHSFAGQHRDGDPMELVLFDVYRPDVGFLPPEPFLAQFGHLRVPEVVYRGDFNQSFVEQVRAGKFPVKEGVVAKGADENGIWLAKIKTQAWLDELRRQAGMSGTLTADLEANQREQRLPTDSCP